MFPQWLLVERPRITCLLEKEPEQDQATLDCLGLAPRVACG